jgi:hypothetical protein
MNVGKDGKAVEEGENTNESDEDEDVKMVKQERSAFNRRTKQPLMRKASERKWILKDKNDQEKFSGIIDGDALSETFVCFFHEKHQKFYMVPLEKAYKFTKYHESTVSYDDAMEELGAGTYADQRYNKFRANLRDGIAGISKDDDSKNDNNQEDTSSRAQQAAKSLFASRYGIGSKKGTKKKVVDNEGSDEDVWNKETDRVAFAMEQGADVEVDRSDDDYENDDERFDSHNIDIDDSDDEYRYDDDEEELRRRQRAAQEAERLKLKVNGTGDDNTMNSTTNNSNDDDVDLDDLKSQAAYGRHTSKYKKRSREEEIAQEGEDAPPKRARIDEEGENPVKKVKKVRAQLSAHGMRNLVQSKGGRITDRELIIAYKHKLNPKKEGSAKNGKLFSQLVGNLLNKTDAVNGEKYYELKD